MLTQVDDVLWTKLHVPQPPAGHVERPRLADQIDAGLGRPGLVLLCAPAGFGKSALLAESCRRRTAGATAWLSLDQADDDPIRFWRHVAASLDQAGDDESSIVQSLDRVGAWDQVADGEAMVTALINATAAATGEVALVLDDYHLIENEAIHRGVRYLIQHAPPGLRVLVASRADPPLQLPRLRSQGRLTEIRAADLRFDVGESSRLLSALTAATITDQVAATLADKTEGWAAGLQLAGLSVNGGTEPDAFAASFTGEHRFVLDYLTEEVLDQQPAEQRRFLLQTSILDRLSGPLCGAVTGRRDSQRQLEAIEAANLFLVPLDDTRRWWRYHHLFGDLLRVRLQQQDADVEELHRRAADWYRHHGEIDRAIHHLWAAGDGTGAAELIESNADGLLLRREGATLQRWLELLPAGLVDSRRLTVARARIDIYGGRLEAAEALLELAGQADPDRAQSSPSAEPVPDRSSGPLDTLDRTARLLRAYVAHMRGDAHTAIELATKAAADTEAASTIGLIARWHLAAGPWLRGDIAEAATALAANAADWRRIGHHDRAALSANRLGRVQRARGDLDAALDAYGQILEHDAAHTGPDAPAAGLAHIGIAEVAYERNDLDTARVRVRLGISMCGDFIYTQALAAGWALLARIRHTDGDQDESRAAMATALKLAPVSQVADLLNPVPAQMAQLAIAQGDLDAAERWSRQRPLAPDTEPTHQREPAELALARLALVKGDPSSALGRLDLLRRLAVEQQRRGSLLEIDVLRALALAATGHDALDTLEAAIDLAAPSRYVRVFADEGQPMVDLLEQLQLRSAHRNDVDHASIDALANVCRPRARPVPGAPPPNEELVVPLTERELDVLAKLVDGKPNKQICAELYISLNTVKKHLTHIFDKLGVTNRTEATVRAREIDLIP